MGTEHSPISIQSASQGDGLSVAKIYNHYIANTVVSFEVDQVTKQEMEYRIKKTLASHLWLIAHDQQRVLGYAYSSPWNARAAYRQSVETSVYLDPTCLGQGVGSRLYDSLLGSLKERGMRTAIGGIALPNDASVRLHEKFGFQKVAHYQQVGFKQNRWIDVGYWQLML